MAYRGLQQIGRIGQLTLRNGVSKKALPVYVTQIRNRVYPDNPGLAYPRDGIEETDEEFDQRYIKYFSKPDIDGWEIRKGINDMHGHDLIPEPKIMIEVLKACRRVNDHSLAVRYLEAVFLKAEHEKKIVDYLMSEIKPTLNELGISTPEEMGYDEPELALGDPTRCPLIETAPPTSGFPK